MAYIVTSESTIADEAVNTLTVPIPVGHQTNDLLLAIITQDIGGTNITTATSGWALLGGTQAAKANQRTVVYWKLAASSSETTLSFSGATDEWVAHILVVRNVNTSNPINTFSGTNSTSDAVQTTTDILTTTVNNCLIIHAMGSDASASIIPQNGLLDFVSRDAAGSQAKQHIGYRNQPTAGSSTAVVFTKSVSDGGQIWSIAVEDADPTNPKMMPETRTTYTPIIYGGSFASLDTNVSSYTKADTLSAATIAGYPLYDTLISLGVTALTDSPVGGFYSCSSSVSGGASQVWHGAVANLTTPVDLTDGIITVQYYLSRNSSSSALMGKEGFMIVFEDSAGEWIAFNSSSTFTIVNITYQLIIDPNTWNPLDESGSVDLSDIVKIGLFYPRAAGTNTASASFGFKNIFLLKNVVGTAGCVEKPVSLTSLKKTIDGWHATNIFLLQGEQQILSKCNFVFGDGTNKTYVNTFSQSNELPQAFFERDDRKLWQVNANTINNKIKLSSTDTLLLTSTIFAASMRSKFSIDSASSPDATYDFSGSSFIGYDIEHKAAGVFFNDCSFTQCYKVVLEGGGLNSVTVAHSLDSTAVVTDSPDLITDSSFISAGTGHAIEITDTGTFNFLGNSFTGYGADGTTNAAIYNNSGGAVTLVLADGDDIPTILNGSGASTTIDAFVESVGVEFTGLVAGSQVVVYTSGTTTELFRDDNSSTTESYDEVTTSLDLDYTIMKAGYVPIRVTGLHLTSVQTIPVQQVVDRAYVASSGLTFDTNAFADPDTNIFDLTTASTVQNFYSFMIESWIAESSLRNVQFPIEPNGPNSFTMSYGWEFADQDAIDFLSRDGMRYKDGSSITAIWISILSIGTATGFTGRYQQVEGDASTDAPNTGAFDQLIQIYGDATHGNFNYDDYLVLKYQPNGYYQVQTDVPAIYGTMADESYTVALEPQAIPNFTTGNPSITGVTITNHGASPVSWDAGNGAKNYSITITDSGTNTGENIMRWVNYNLSLGGTFQGDEAFNYPDMIVTDGTLIETERGTIIGSAGATLKGVRVIRTGDVPHPDFYRFQADDGTYGLAPQVQSVTVTNGIAGTRIQVYDLTSSTELYNGTPTFPYTWQDSSPYVADREIRVRAMYTDGTDAYLFIDTVIGTSTDTDPALSVRLNQEVDTVYNTNAIDGSLVTDITIDDSALLIEVDTGTISWKDIYAYETYWLFTEEGIRDEGRIIDAKDTANYAFYNFQIKNITSPEVPLTITDGWGYDSVTNQTIDLFDTTGGAIFAAPDRVIAFATGSGLSPTEQAQLALVEQIKPNTDLIPATL